MSVAEVPVHTHALVGTTATATGRLTGPTQALASSTGSAAYAPPSTPLAMSTEALGPMGGSQAHENRQPFLCLSFCIALQGIFPSQN